MPALPDLPPGFDAGIEVGGTTHRKPDRPDLAELERLLAIQLWSRAESRKLRAALPFLLAEARRVETLREALREMPCFCHKAGEESDRDDICHPPVITLYDKDFTCLRCRSLGKEKLSPAEIEMRGMMAEEVQRASLTTCLCGCCKEAHNRERHGRADYASWCSCLDYPESERCDCAHCIAPWKENAMDADWVWGFIVGWGSAVVCGGSFIASDFDHSEGCPMARFSEFGTGAGT